MSAIVPDQLQQSSRQARLRVQNLGLSFGVQPLVRGINFSLAAGEIGHLAGENGSGKSSILNYWLNDMLDPPHRGAQRILGWSFYAGSPSAGPTSADSFMKTIFQWLSDEVSDGT